MAKQQIINNINNFWQKYFSKISNFFCSQNNSKNYQLNSLNYLKSSIVLANVNHQRLSPKINQFTYQVFYFCFDISKIAHLKKFFLSINRFNLFSFYFKDHGKKDGSSLESWIRNLLIEKNLNHLVDKIYLFTHPRVLNYVFNPVSFWFCVDSENNLRAVLFEVNNTFSQTHSYLVYNPDHSIITKDQWFATTKNFYVSPFFEVIGNYKFRVIFNPKKIAVWIDYYQQDQKKLLTSAISYQILSLTSPRLLLAFIKIPLVTFKVIILIHWQALKLFFKGIKFVKNPNQIPNKITTNN